MSSANPDQDHECHLPDGRIICYREYGARDGMPVLALHGTPGSRLKYRIAHDDALACGLRLITPDRWGYGRTSTCVEPTLTAYADDAHALMSSCGFAKFGVVGISGGGPFAAAVAARNPLGVTALALVAPVGRVAEPDHRGTMSIFHWFCFRVLPHIPGAVRLAFLILRAIALNAPAAAIKLVTVRAGPADKTLMAPYEKRLPLGLTFAEGLRPGASGPVIDLDIFSRPWDIDPSTIACPTQLWIGGQDRNVPIPAARKLAGAIPTCRTVAHDDHGHFWISGNFAVVLQWLAETCER